MEVTGSNPVAPTIFFEGLQGICPRSPSTIRPTKRSSPDHLRSLPQFLHERPLRGRCFVASRRSPQRPSHRSGPEQGMEESMIRPPDKAAESAPRTEEIEPCARLCHTPQCCTKCCTNRHRNAPERPLIPCIHLYFTTTYTKLGRFVIDRSSVQVRSSAPDLAIRFLKELPQSLKYRCHRLGSRPR